MNYDHGGDLFALAGKMGMRFEELVDFSASINPLGISPAIRNAIIESMDGLVHYPYAYAEPLCAALADYHGVDPGRVLAANGTTELIYLLPRVIPGRRAMIVAPAFSEYEKALSAAGWEVRHHCLSYADLFSLSVDELARALAGNDYQLLFFCNPGNPTGRLYSLEEITAVASLCRSLGVLLVLDEAFIDFCGEDASAISTLVPDGGVIVLRSMTKFYAIPGLRLGYAVTDAPTAAAISRSRGPWSVNSLALAAGMAALGDADFRKRTLDYLATARESFAAGLADIKGVSPFAGAANYLLVRLSAPLSSAEVRLRLLGQRLVIRDCVNFRGLDDSFIRTAIRCTDENAMLVTALRDALSDGCCCC